MAAVPPKIGAPAPAAKAPPPTHRLAAARGSVLGPSPPTSGGDGGGDDITGSDARYEISACVEAMQEQLQAVYNPEELGESEEEGGSGESSREFHSDDENELRLAPAPMASMESYNAPRGKKGLEGLLEESKPRVTELLEKLNTEDRHEQLRDLDEWYRKHEGDARRDARRYEAMFKRKMNGEPILDEEDSGAVQVAAPDALAQSFARMRLDLERFMKRLKHEVGDDVSLRKAYQQALREYEKDVAESVGKEVVQEAWEKVEHLKGELEFILSGGERDAKREKAETEFMENMQEQAREKREELEQVSAEANDLEKRCSAVALYMLQLEAGRFTEDPSDEWLKGVDAELRGAILQSRIHEVMAYCPTVQSLDRQAKHDREAAEVLTVQITEKEEELKQMIERIKEASADLISCKENRTLIFPSKAVASYEVGKVVKERDSIDEVVQGLCKKLRSTDSFKDQLQEAKEELLRRTEEAIESLNEDCAPASAGGDGGGAAKATPSTWRTRFEANWREAQVDAELYARALYGAHKREDYSFTGFEVDELEATNESLWMSLNAMEEALRSRRSSGRATRTSTFMSPRSTMRGGGSSISPRGSMVGGSSVSPRGSMSPKASVAATPRRGRSRANTMRPSETVASRVLVAARAELTAVACDAPESTLQVRQFRDFLTDEDEEARKKFQSSKRSYTQLLASLRNLLDELAAETMTAQWSSAVSPRNTMSPKMSTMGRTRTALKRGMSTSFGNI